MNVRRVIRKTYRSLVTNLYTYIVKVSCGSFNGLVKAHGFCRITKTTYLGRNVHFNGISIIGKGRVTIGDNFHSGIQCMILTDIHNYEGVEIPYDSKKIVKDIKIEDNVWIGNRVMILGGVTIGEGSIIQAGSVVVSDIPKCAIAGGHPARVFKYRDKDHYYLLKEQKRFH